MSKPNWIKIKNEYLTTNISQRKLADKYGVSYNTIKDKSKAESWYKQKKETHRKITAKAQQKTEDFIVQSQIERTKKLHHAVDLLLDKVLEAVPQLDTYIVNNKKTVKETEYNNDCSPNKPTKETTTETEILEVIDGNIDRPGLRALASAMKDIKDIINTSGAGDSDENDIAKEILNAISGKAKTNQYLEDSENDD